MVNREKQMENRPQVTLSIGGYQELRERVVTFQTDLMNAPKYIVEHTLNVFQEKIGPYMWLSIYDIVELMEDIDKVRTYDMTRQELSNRCSELIQAIDEQIEKK